MTQPAHHFAVVRRLDGKLEWKYSETGFAPADALYVTTSWPLCEQFIRQQEAIERERADADARALAAQAGLFG